MGRLIAEPVPAAQTREIRAGAAASEGTLHNAVRCGRSRPRCGV